MVHRATGRGAPRTLNNCWSSRWDGPASRGLTGRSDVILMGVVPCAAGPGWRWPTERAVGTVAVGKAFEPVVGGSALDVGEDLELADSCLGTADPSVKVGRDARLTDGSGIA